MITFSRDLAKTSPNIGSKVLLVDDLADSGITLKKSIDRLQHIYGFYLDDPSSITINYSNILGGQEGIVTNDNGEVSPINLLSRIFKRLFSVLTMNVWL